MPKLKRSFQSLVLLCALLAGLVHAIVVLAEPESFEKPDGLDYTAHPQHSRHQRASIVVTGEVGDAESQAAATTTATGGSNKSTASTPATDTAATESVPATDNSTATIAQVLDQALIKEFEQDTKDAESEKGKTFNETVAKDEVSRLLHMQSGTCCLCFADACQTHRGHTATERIRILLA